jgi:diguanylate cyclase
MPTMGAREMKSDAIERVEQCADKAMSSMRACKVLRTPQNFAIWYEYHEGNNLDLSRTIDKLLSTRGEFTEELLEEVYEKFFTTNTEQRALREMSRRVQNTLKEVLAALGEAGRDTQRFGMTLRNISGEIVAGRTSLADLISSLVAETDEMARRGELLNLKLTQAAQTIKMLKADLEDVRRDAMTDALTGLANRKLFDATLNEAAIMAFEDRCPLTLLMVDIDHFKKFNDICGHQTGDEILKLVAHTLKNNVKGQDLVCRYGGDEFVILLPGTSLDNANIVGENIRRAFEQRRIVKKGTSDPIGGITISVGAARYELGEPVAALIQRADEALYRAKREGRNRVVAVSSG